METKQCNKCKLILPKTNEYFIIQVQKPTEKNRLVNNCYSFRGTCRICSNVNFNTKRRDMRCDKLGIDIYDKDFSMRYKSNSETRGLDYPEKQVYYRAKRKGLTLLEYKELINRKRNKITLEGIKRFQVAGVLRLRTNDITDELYILYNKHIKFYRDVKHKKNNKQ